MTGAIGTIGIIGGAGSLGGAIAQALLARGGVAPGDLWISNRSGRAEAPAGVHVTADNAELAAACGTVILSVPPARAGEIGIAAGGRLVISVMAGVTVREIAALTGATRVVRAMSSPAAGRGLAYSPWVAAPGVTAEDRARVAAAACGTTDEIGDERLIDTFTAMTGPVPGFVAYYAQCMVDYARARGVPEAVADRAVRQLFLGAGQMLAESEETPAEQVRAMIDYAGTTAAGLVAMIDSPVKAGIFEGLDAAADKARKMR